MKQRLYALAFLAFSFALTSCQKDEDPAPVPEVVGKWSLDYGILLSGFSNNPQDLLVNGEKIDPGSPFFWDLGFPVSTLHVMESNKLFVNITKQLLWTESFSGTWDYTTPKLTLNYDESSIDNEEYTYSIENGLEQLSIDQTIEVDTLGNTGKIQWIYHK